MNESYPHLFSRWKRLDKRLQAYIRFREGNFVKPETIRGAWQSGAVADSEQFTAGVRNSLLLCLNMLTKTFRADSSSIGAA